MIFLMIFFVVLLLVELIYFQLANRFNIIDKPNERSSHSKITLRGGGIVFPIAALLFFCLYGFAYPWFMVGLVAISIVSFWDDLRTLSRKFRLGVQLSAILLMFYQAGLFYEYLWLIPVLLIFCGGIINAYNFMDGINGITGGYSLIVLLGLSWVNIFVVEFIDQHFLNCIIVSLLVFNFFNFRTKAKCFAGDVGSVSIAFIILFALGLLMLKTRDFSWICFLAVYGVDSVLTIFHRILLKENITKPHRKHLYQLLANELKFPQIFVSLIYMLVQSIVIIGYLVCRQYLEPLGIWAYVGVVLLVLSLFYVTAKLKWFHLHER
jgi:UDP-N-acetylmuramyl pentapeptide phosphotransferase/UDP-N-acetylglucosamine-1-phosphate transferase